MVIASNIHSSVHLSHKYEECYYYDYNKIYQKLDVKILLDTVCFFILIYTDIFKIFILQQTFDLPCFKGEMKNAR